MDASPTPQPRWFYGWNIVAAGVLCQFFSVGLAFYSFGVFLDPLIAEFGWTKADTSLGFSCYTIATAVGNVLFGRLLARGSARRLTIFGSLLVGAGLALMGTVRSLPEMYLYMGALIGLGVVAVGGITSATLINHWFLMRRAMAIAIASAGVSAGGLLSTPLIERLIHAVGWRNAYFALGAAEVAVILPIALFLLRDTPEEMGLHPDGVRPAKPRDANGPADPNERLWTYRETLTNRSFYLLLASFTLNLGSLTAVIVHMVSDVTAKGFGRPTAAFAYSICAGVGLFAKPAFGWFGDRFPKRAGAAASALLQAAGTAALITLPAHGSLLLVAVPLGLGVAGAVPMFAATTAEIFGRRSYAMVSSLMSVFVIGTQALTYWAAGRVFDVTGSYRPAHLVFLGMYLLSAILALGLSTETEKARRAGRPAEPSPVVEV